MIRRDSALNAAVHFQSAGGLQQRDLSLADGNEGQARAPTRTEGLDESRALNAPPLPGDEMPIIP